MAKYSEELELSIKDNNLLNYLKDYFDKKENNSCIVVNNHIDEKNSNITILTFNYLDTIRSYDLKITVNIYLSYLHSLITKIEIIVDDEKINENDLLLYFLSFYKECSMNVVNKKSKKYTVRNYYSILHQSGFKGEYIIKLNNTTKVKQLTNNPYKNVAAERIVALDCEVDAISLTDARTKSYNITKDIAAFLSVLLNRGFFEYRSIFSNFVRKVKDTKGIEMLCGEMQREAFIDDELGLVVRDNMNGLQIADDFNKDKRLTYFSFTTLDENLNVISSFSENNEFNNNKELDKIFKDKLKITKSKNLQSYYCDDIENHAAAQAELKIPRCIKKYFKSLEELKKDDEKRYNNFRNCARLYNLAYTQGIYEPSLMVSYMVSAIEALAKSEKMYFTEFMKKYLEGEYDKDICDLIYGNIRSGHFHSGEFFFNEYSLNMDIALNHAFEKQMNIFVKSRVLLRRAIINWIKKELLMKESKQK